MTDSKDNPSAFKHWINAALLKRMAKALTSAYAAFDSKTFLAISKKFESLELKPRVQLVRTTLYELLPKNFPKAVKILLKSLQTEKLDSFDLWPYTDYIQTYGLDHFEESMEALQILTQLFTAEFAVRPFLKAYPEKTLKLLSQWAKHENTHVRRWVSEGTRPRLPWGERLDHFVKDPHFTLPLLDLLKNDPELYVRKSIANHLNDIAKDHPEVVVKTLKEWLSKSENEHLAKLQWIRNHALRTLIKKGYAPALELLGINLQAAINVGKVTLNKKSYRVNESVEFTFHVQSLSKNEEKLIIDYVIHHVKSNKSRTPKVFKLKNVVLKPGQSLQITKKHSLKLVTTRKYYPGEHWIEIQVNGRVFSRCPWVLAL